MYVEYSIIPYTSTFIRLSNFYQEFYAHCIVIVNDERGDGIGVCVCVCVCVCGRACWWVVDLYQSVNGGPWGGYYLIVVGLFFLLILSFVLSGHLSLF